MTRVAIHFSGTPRLFNRLCINRWQEHIRTYNADVFIHQWLPFDSKRTNTYDQLVNLFGPKVIKLEPMRFYNTDIYKDRIRWSVVPYNVLSLFTSVYESMNLVNHYSYTKGFEYDYVIRARTDVFIPEINLTPVEGVVIPNDSSKHCLTFSYMEQNTHGVNDVFAYGSQSAMTMYSSTIKYIEKLYLEENVDMCSEIFLRATLMKRGIPIDFKNIPYILFRR